MVSLMTHYQTCRHNRGNRASSFSASRDSSTAQAMFYGAPRLGLSTLELGFAFSDFPFLRLCQRAGGFEKARLDLCGSAIHTYSVSVRQKLSRLVRTILAAPIRPLCS